MSSLAHPVFTGGTCMTIPMMLLLMENIASFYVAITALYCKVVWISLEQL
jgi:hypothetical protein